MNRFPLFVGIAVVALGLVGYSSLFIVFQTEQALVLRLGEPKRVISEPGLAYKVPFLENVVFFDKRVLDYDVRAQEIPSLDQKQLLVDAFTRYRIIDPLKFFQTVTHERGMESRLDSIISSNLRAVFGNVPLAAVMTPKRAALMDDIHKQVKIDAGRFGIDVIDVRLKRVDLPPENSQAIFRRMQTQREQEARKFRATGDRRARERRADADKQVTIIRAEARKKAEILKGEGEAGAQKLYNDAFGRDPDFFKFWVTLDTMRAGLAGESTNYIGPPEGILFQLYEGMDGGSGDQKK